MPGQAGQATCGASHLGLPIERAARLEGHVCGAAGNPTRSSLTHAAGLTVPAVLQASRQHCACALLSPPPLPAGFPESPAVPVTPPTSTRCRSLSAPRPLRPRPPPAAVSRAARILAALDSNPPPARLLHPVVDFVKAVGGACRLSALRPLLQSADSAVRIH